METKVTTQTLLDYVDAREDVVLFWAGVGTPTGDCEPLGHQDIHFAGRRRLLELTGTVDADGDWRWDGEGSPTDDRANSITKLHAYVDEKQWRRLVNNNT